MYKIYNQDCIEGIKQHIADDSVDLIFTDPPYGIEGDKLDKHYARDESKVVPGYIDVPYEEYQEFSNQWISECARVLKPGGSMYVISGYTCLREILNAFAQTDLVEVNHLIGHYTFGVSTRTKWVSSHYHILYYVKPPIKKKTFNTFCRFSDMGDSYTDRLSVQEMKRDYKPGQKKNKNQLPEGFIEKFILYSSNRGDVVMDPFMGGFTTARVALKYGRDAIGFEANDHAYNAFVGTLDEVNTIDDPTPIDPSPEVMAQRLKKREGYKRAKARKKA
jgi:site-specific DNA-methyltransferase (adenine-specific)